MHLLSAAAHCPDLAGLIDHPATFGHVWPVLGWNIHIHHPHLDVHSAESGCQRPSVPNTCPSFAC